MKLPRRFTSFTWVAVPLAALAGDPAPPAVSASALQACAALSTEAARLACYDKLAGRAPTAAAGPAAPARAPAAAAAAAAAGSVAPSQAPAKQAATSRAAAGTAQAPAATTAPPAAPEAFGLYAAEHPKPVATSQKSETLKILSVSSSPGGYPLVHLEGGQLWELSEGDPLLASGESVTIQRAALGSFLMTTPNGRTHRARRVQ